CALPPGITGTTSARFDVW
nr:immunoglobulin heavy chain junction region [Macaca mulatta]MOW23437.1 immunoglobulin heavy chain junction region [Macaca mulatta]MOW24756.1 immunoglobulin heavy chain junction region [Macaca mulatta]MOW25735.1 immunoglobulin heavy chain junction region [Macaca mulatta]MOW25839.1 immunoglobulin heavy chain junction region [Macaca mulatta]